MNWTDWFAVLAMGAVVIAIICIVIEWIERQVKK